MNKDINREQELLAQIEQLKQKVETLQKRKKYGLVWEDKPEEFDEISKNAFPLLREKGGKFKDINPKDEGDYNILIEGDNYHALSVLNYTHRGAIDVIYIDPPYNTGKDGFRYKDKRTANKYPYGQLVPKDHPYRHTLWLSFMHKRLLLAKHLLKKDGVIFISIDDNEQVRLKMLCDEIFGESNFIENLLWLNKEGGGGSDSNHFKRKEEYVLVYGKSKDLVTIQGEESEENDSYAFEDEYVSKRGRYKLIKLSSRSLGYIKTLDYPVECPDGTYISPNRDEQKVARWRWSKKKYDWGVKAGFVHFEKRDNKWVCYTKQYFKVDNKDEPIVRTLPPLARIEEFSSTMGTKELDAIMGSKIFSYPKPSKLIKKLINFMPNKDAVIFDFFSGSGTTGHAVLELNKEDGGNRKFILNTNNENSICEEVTYERIKRVMSGYTNAKGENVAGLGGKLKYLKTDFMPKQVAGKITDEDKLSLAYEAGLILAMKEDTFDKQEETAFYQIFNGVDKVTAIYFRENKEKLNELLEKLEQSGIQTKLYIFSWDKGAYQGAFSEYENIMAEDIPEPILEVYKSIGI